MLELGSTISGRTRAPIARRPLFAVHPAGSYTSGVPETREDPEPLPELPPLGESDETDAEGDFSDLLRSFDGDGGLDDSESDELDAGVDIDEDGPDDPEGAEQPLDIGEIVQASDDEEGSAGDEVGPDGEVAGSLFDDGGALEMGGDDAEGTVEPENLIPEELPVLLQDEGEQEGTLNEESDELLGMGEEDPPRRAELPWLELPPTDLPECRVVRSRKGLVAAGGSGVVFIGPEGDVLRLSESLGDAVTGLLVDADARSVLACTERGALYRLLGPDAAPESLAAFREVLALDREKALSLSLAGPTPSSRPAALLHVSAGGGVLLESTDRGVTWRKVDLGGQVLAVSTGAPPYCLVEEQDGLRLFRSEPTGAFRRLSTELTSDEHAELASDGDVVALLEPGLGVRVSADGGVSFRRAAGSARATAVTAGRLGGRPSAFTALFDAASGHTSLVWIDAASADAHVVSELSPDPELENELDEWAKVVSLAWDAEDETLWAAGVFGVRRWRRPPSA